VLRDIGADELVARSGVSRSALGALCAGTSRPRATRARHLCALAADYARHAIGEEANELRDVVVLAAFKEVRANSPRACPECGGQLTSSRARYCGSKCRKRASRKRAGDPKGLTTRSVHPPTTRPPATTTVCSRRWHQQRRGHLQQQWRTHRSRCAPGTGSQREEQHAGQHRRLTALRITKFRRLVGLPGLPS
jgi:hypothetical protein